MLTLHMMKIATCLIDAATSRSWRPSNLHRDGELYFFSGLADAADSNTLVNSTSQRAEFITLTIISRTMLSLVLEFQACNPDKLQYYSQ